MTHLSDNELSLSCPGATAKRNKSFQGAMSPPKQQGIDSALRFSSRFDKADNCLAACPSGMFPEHTEPALPADSISS